MFRSHIYHKTMAFRDPDYMKDISRKVAALQENVVENADCAAWRKYVLLAPHQASRQVSATWQDVWHSMQHNTSMHGLRSVVRARGPFKKTFWVAIMSLAFVYLLYGQVSVFRKYFTYPVRVTLQVKQVNELTFPAVTLCNMSPVRKEILVNGRLPQIVVTPKGEDLASTSSRRKRDKDSRKVKRKTSLHRSRVKRAAVELYLCQSGWSVKLDKCYKVFNNQSTFLDSEADCVYRNAHLASISTQTINDYVTQIGPVDSGGTFWIGLIISENNNENQWTDGAPYGYNLLDNDPTNQESVVIDATGQWSSSNSHPNHKYICHKNGTLITTTAEPTTTVEPTTNLELTTTVKSTTIGTTTTILVDTITTTALEPTLTTVETKTTLEPTTTLEPATTTVESTTTLEPTTPTPTLKLPSTTVDATTTVQPTTTVEPTTTVKSTTIEPTTTPLIPLTTRVGTTSTAEPTLITLETTTTAQTLPSTTKKATTTVETTTTTFEPIMTTVKPITTTTVKLLATTIEETTTTEATMTTVEITAEEPTAQTSETTATVEQATQIEPTTTVEPTTTLEPTIIVKLPNTTVEATITVEPTVLGKQTSAQGSATIKTTSTKTPTTVESKYTTLSTIVQSNNHVTIGPKSIPSSCCCTCCHTRIPAESNDCGVCAGELPVTVSPTDNQCDKQTKQTSSIVTTPLDAMSLASTAAAITTKNSQENLMEVGHTTTPEVITLSESQYDTVYEQSRITAFGKAERFVETLAELDYEIKQSYGFQAEKTILDCRYSGYSCQPHEFSQFFNPVYGNCFTFNSGWPSEAHPNGTQLRTATRPGRRHGLKLILNINQQNYVSDIVDSAGLRIVVHSADRLPFPEDEGIIVGPGHATSIGIKQLSQGRMSEPYGNCTDTRSKHSDINVYEEIYPHSTYSAAACEKTCYQKNVISRCGCGDPYFPLVGAGIGAATKVKACRASNHSQSGCQKSVSNEYNERLFDCNCPNTCSDVVFSLEVSEGSWPSNVQKDDVLTSLASLVGDSFNVHEDEELSNNILKLDIYYENFRYEHIDESPQYESDKFMSQIGGTFGLCVGFSVMTMVEFVEIGMDYIMIVLEQIINKRTQRK